MKVLVTGAAGFVGHHLVPRLVERGHRVRALVHSRDKAERRLAGVLADVELAEGDVTDPDGLRRHADGMDAVVHLVAIPIEKGDATYERINHQGTVHVVDAARAAGATRFVMASQNGANAQSFSPFLRSKGRATDYVEASDLRWSIVHPSLVFGPGDKVFTTLARTIRLTPLVYPDLEGGRTEFQPVHVGDVVEVLVRVLEDDAAIGRHYDLGGPEVLPLGTIVRRVLDVLGERRFLLPVPARLMAPPTALLHRLLPQPPASVDLLKLLEVPNVVLHANALPDFGIDPTPFAGEHLAYLRATSAGEALRTFLGQKPE